MPSFRLFPIGASTSAAEVDHLFFFLAGVSGFFALLIFLVIFYFAIRYRRRSKDEVAGLVHEPRALEVTWIVIPFIITIGMFVWGAKLFSDQFHPPADAEEIFVVGKQWMWKLQHQEGNREINELHIPIGRPIKLVMTSEDVIHDFFVPAFRVKKDVIPGRYTSLWFKPTRLGRYRFFCSQYCGTSHSLMRGWVTVMTPADYDEWLNSGAPTRVSMALAGERLYQRFFCADCHQSTDTTRGPSLAGIYGKKQMLEGGQSIIADDAYLRDSIVTPRAQIVAGYQPLMPTYQGQVNEEQLLQLIAYIKSLSAQERKTQQ